MTDSNFCSHRTASNIRNVVSGDNAHNDAQPTLGNEEDSSQEDYVLEPCDAGIEQHNDSDQVLSQKGGRRWSEDNVTLSIMIHSCSIKDMLFKNEEGVMLPFASPLLEVTEQ